jgi:ribosomal protein L37AE/L43A
LTVVEKKIALLRRAFGEPQISRDSREAQFFCPQCKKAGKKKRKLSIRLEDGVYHCWVCELKGKSLSYLFRQYAPSLQDYLRDAGFSGGSSGHREEERAPEPAPVLTVPAGFTLLAASSRAQDPDVKDCIKYCHTRGLGLGDLWYFKLGTCKEGRFRRRVVFPSFDSEGTLNYFTARAIDQVTSMKYVNSKVSKTEVIFNEINIDWRRPLTLVEGPFDLTKTVGNATCLLGSSLSRESALFRQIVRHGTPITLALDPDVRKKSHNIAKLLAGYGIDVSTVDVPADRDIGDMTKGEYSDLISTARPWQSSDRLLHLISNIRSGSII